MFPFLWYTLPNTDITGNWIAALCTLVPETQAIPWRWGGMKDSEVCGSKSFHKQNLRQHVRLMVSTRIWNLLWWLTAKGWAETQNQQLTTNLWGSCRLFPEDVCAGHRSQPSLLLPKEERTEQVSEELCKAGLRSKVVVVWQLGDVFSFSHFRGLILLHYRKKEYSTFELQISWGFCLVPHTALQSSMALTAVCYSWEEPLPVTL